MNLRKILNRPEKPIGKLIYITNLNLFFDSLPIDPRLEKHRSYKDIQRFAIIEPNTDLDRSLLKNPFWLGHAGDHQDDGKYPMPITHFWGVNPLHKYEYCYIPIDLPLFTEKDFLEKDIEDKELQERLHIILENIINN